MENGRQNSLTVPSSKNLTQAIILKSVTKPDPLVFSAKDEKGQPVLINLSSNVTVELSQYGSDVTLNLIPGVFFNFSKIVCSILAIFRYFCE